MTVAEAEATATRTDSAVSISSVSKTYRAGSRSSGVQAVQDVDLEVRRGELVVLLGPSGCGKTTLLRCVAGLEVPDAGTVEIGRRRVFDSATGTYLPPERRSIGMMFQSYALWPHLKVFENVAFPLRSAGVTREEIGERVTAQLAALGVGGLEDRYPSELSGGQQQRVALARALVAEPSVILFDEPLSNVDARVRRRLRAQLRELKRETGFAGVYVTHDQEEAMELADTLAVMENGRIQQSGTTREVYRSPSSLYVADFLGELSRMPATYRAGGGAATARTPLGEVPVHTTGAIPSDGESGHVVARPEELVVGLQPGDGAAADVVEAVYYGSFTELKVSLDGLELLIRHPGDLLADAVSGDRVFVRPSVPSLLWLSR